MKKLLLLILILFPMSASAKEFTSQTDAVSYVRECFIGKADNVDVTFPVNYQNTKANHEQAMDDFYDAVMGEDDYLRYSIDAVHISLHDGIAEDGYVTKLSYTFVPVYRTSKVQEAEIDKKIRKIIKSLNLNGKSTYRKILEIYKYVTSHVDFDHKYGKLSYTVYNPVMNGKATCQGYAMLTYRLMQEAGIPCRIIVGTYTEFLTNSHAWNIVQINGKWYGLDSTHDRGKSAKKYKHFLVGLNHLNGYKAIYPCMVSKKDYRFIKQKTLSIKKSKWIKLSPSMVCCDSIKSIKSSKKMLKVRNGKVYGKKKGTCNLTIKTKRGASLKIKVKVR